MTITQEDALRIAYEVSSTKPSLKNIEIESGLSPQEMNIDWNHHLSLFIEEGIL